MKNKKWALAIFIAVLLSVCSVVAIAEVAEDATIYTVEAVQNEGAISEVKTEVVSEPEQVAEPVQEADPEMESEAVSDEDGESERASSHEVTAPTATHQEGEHAEPQDIEARVEAETTPVLTPEEQAVEEQPEEEQPSEEQPVDDDEVTEEETLPQDGDFDPEETEEVDEHPLPSSVSVLIFHQGETLCYGDTVTLMADVTEPVSFQWQMSRDGGASWEHIDDATEKTMNVTITAENEPYLWRVAVY